MRAGIGQPVRRKEDRRLLTGRGCYSDDFTDDRQAYAVVLRSPHAHARIGTIATDAARAAPGVLAVLTAAEYTADGHGGIPHGPNPNDAVEPKERAFPEAAVFEAPQMPLADEKVRHVGEGVALAVARTREQALDAAELIEVDYQPLPAVTRQSDAVAAGAPKVWDGAAGNLCVRSARGDAAATEAAFAAAHRVVEMELVNNRVINCQMEPRAALGIYDAEGDRYTLYAGHQGVSRIRATLAATLKVPIERIRCVCRDVGGGFGPRNWLNPEFVLVLWAARRVGRPVKWTSERSEAFLADTQGRDLVTRAALALDAEGRFVAMRSALLSNVGAHTISFTPLSNGSRLVTTVYDIAAAHCTIAGAVTNTQSTGPYRGAGRPEAVFAIERLIDTAAAEMGIDRIELRRRNLVPAAAMPYRSPMGLTYDCGEFERGMDMALEIADWQGFAARREAARARGRLAGIGLANYIEAPVGAPVERAEIRVDPKGRVEVVLGTQSQGQGHETSFAQVICQWLGVDFDAVELVTGDTDRVSKGGGTHSDRSMRIAGAVMVEASEKIIDSGRRAASQLLEAAATDIDFADGCFTVAGTDRSIGLFEVAAAMAAGEVQGEVQGRLEAEADFWGRLPAHPNGTAVCEIEIDPDTGALEILRYATVDDVGRVINPMIVHGQTHGGIAMGVGQAMLEDAVYDPGTGQLLSGSFMDYCVARADDLPSFRGAFNPVPTAGNPLGVKGGGEGGTSPAPAALVNAVVDALGEFGIRHIDMPVTAERIWRALRDAQHRD